jgi:hypothetical protein
MLNVTTTNNATRGVERDDVFCRPSVFVVAHMQYESESTILVEVVAKLGIVMLGPAKLCFPELDFLHRGPRVVGTALHMTSLRHHTRRANRERTLSLR